MCIFQRHAKMQSLPTPARQCYGRVQSCKHNHNNTASLSFSREVKSQVECFVDRTAIRNIIASKLGPCEFRRRKGVYTSPLAPRRSLSASRGAVPLTELEDLNSDTTKQLGSGSEVRAHHELFAKAEEQI